MTQDKKIINPEVFAAIRELKAAQDKLNEIVGDEAEVADQPHAAELSAIHFTLKQLPLVKIVERLFEDFSPVKEEKKKWTVFIPFVAKLEIEAVYHGVEANTEEEAKQIAFADWKHGSKKNVEYHSDGYPIQNTPYFTNNEMENGRVDPDDIHAVQIHRKDEPQGTTK